MPLTLVDLPTDDTPECAAVMASPHRQVRVCRAGRALGGADVVVAHVPEGGYVSAGFVKE